MPSILHAAFHVHMLLQAYLNKILFGHGALFAMSMVIVGSKRDFLLLIPYSGEEPRDWTYSIVSCHHTMPCNCECSYTPPLGELWRNRNDEGDLTELRRLRRGIAVAFATMASIAVQATRAIRGDVDG